MATMKICVILSLQRDGSTNSNQFEFEFMQPVAGTNLSQQQGFFIRTGTSHEWNCRCILSPRDVPANSCVWKRTHAHPTLQLMQDKLFPAMCTNVIINKNKKAFARFNCT